MRRTRSRLTVLALLATAVASVPAVDARADDPKAPPAAPQATPDGDAKALVADVLAAASKHDDPTANANVAKLATFMKHPDVTAAVKDTIPSALEKYGHEFDRAPVAAGAIRALGELPADASGKPLRSLLAKAMKAKEPPPEIWQACLDSLKKVADPSKATTEALLDLLKRKENEIVGRAADALSGYRNAPGKLRRDLMEEVLKTGESSYQASRDGKDRAAVTKWNTIRNGVMAALNALSFTNHADPAAARQWYNDHKKDSKFWGG